MNAWRTVLLGGVAAGLLSGCVAAVVPVAAAGLIGKSRLDHGSRQKRQPQAQALQRPPSPPTDVPPAATVVPSAAVAPATAAAAVPPGMQYLYGSGEAAALSRQSYMQLANFLLARQSDQQVGNTVYSVVLAPGATLDKPVFEPCGDKPMAIVLDIDETALLNAGFEADQVRSGGTYDPKRWDSWEKTGADMAVPAPGAVDALFLARHTGFTVVFNSNRLAANADATAAALDHAGLGTAKHGDTLWLKGDAGGGDAKDPRRWAISAKYCVVAMVGDQLGDFSDLFNASALGFAERRSIAMARKIDILWGQGWFILPNPVYGTGLKGSMDEVFPPQVQWSPPNPAPPQEK